MGTADVRSHTNPSLNLPTDDRVGLRLNRSCHCSSILGRLLTNPTVLWSYVMQRTQHPSNNSVLGAPPNTTIEQCSALPITRIEYGDGTQAVASYWRPSAEELKLLQQGALVCLTILGTTHAPLKIEVSD